MTQPSKPSPAQVSLAEGQRLVVWSIVANVLLLLIKGFVGIVGNSYALIADAIESGLDILSSILVWIGLTVSARPADENHPYGHGKAEPLAGIAVAVVLLVAAVTIAVQSIAGLVTPRLPPEPFTLYVLVGVIAIKEILFRRTRALSAKIGSTALEGEAWHQRSDALTSLAAAIGISMAIIGGPAFAAADCWAALFTAWVIGYHGASVLRGALYELSDAAPDSKLERQVRDTAQSVAGVLGTHRCHVRKMGIEYYVDLDVIVDGSMTVTDSHRLAHEVQDAIRASHPMFTRVLIHIEPPREPHGSCHNV